MAALDLAELSAEVERLRSLAAGGRGPAELGTDPLALQLWYVRLLSPVAIKGAVRGL